MMTGLWLNRVLLTLLSIMTGVVKLISMNDEMVLFRGAGIPDGATWLFGAMQLLGGVLLLVPRFTRGAAWWMAGTFTLATIVVFINGMLAFGIASLLFIASAIFHAMKWPSP